MWKKCRKALAVILATSVCAGSMIVQAEEPSPKTDSGGDMVSYTLTDGLIVDFDMDSMVDNAVSNKADDKAFTVQGTAPTLVDGKEGHNKALQFDGKTNYIDLGKDYQILQNQTTIAAWVKVDSSPNGLSRITCRSRTAVQDEKDLSLYVRNNGKLETQGTPSWLASNEGAVALDQWQHVAVTYDGTIQNLYVNGEIVQTAQVTDAEIDPNWQAVSLLVGAGWNEEGTAPFGDHMFKGALDDLKIYTRPLSQAEIKTLADIKEEGGDSGDVTLPDALYEFTMNEIQDGTGELEGQKVITSSDGTEYPIYGDAKVDNFGIYDQSIVFNGTNTYVNIGKPDINNEYTMSAWIYLEKGAANTINKIFGRDRTTVGERAFYIGVRGDKVGYVQATLDGASVTAEAGAVPFGEWVNLAITNTPEESCIYVNGKLVSKGSGSNVDQRTHSLDMLIGCGYNATGDGIFNGHAFKGRIDDVRIYNQALNAEQISKNTEGIFEKIPPEVNEINPAQGELIDAAGQLKIEFNMPISVGDKVPSVTDTEGKLVDAGVKLLDLDGEEGTETFMITPVAKLSTGKTYTYTIPAGTVVNANGVGNQALSYTYTVKQSLDGDAGSSDLDYWVSNDVQIPSEVKKDGNIVTLSNGLVERTFDISKNFVTASYKNLYTGISLLNNENLQADIYLSLTDTYKDDDTSGDTLFYVGGESDTVPTFQYESYTVEDQTEEIFHWEYDERMSPPSMKDADWPAKGKALVVNYTAPDNADTKYAGVKVQVRYEIYDGIPVICKKINVTNEGENDVIVHRMTVEALPVNTAVKDALYLEGSLNAGPNHDRNNGRLSYINWESKDDTYGVQTHQYAVPNGSKRSYGPNYRISTGETFTSYRLYELFYSSSYFEWQTMEIKKMYRVLFPQTLDAPLIYHCISSNPDTVKKAVDEAANAGFNMVLLSFGSGVNTEDVSAGNIAKYKELVDYAHSKNIMLGAYMMQVARGDGSADDIYNGGWGRMRCLTAEAAKKTQENVLKFIDETGLDCMEIDGVYPGGICTLDHADKEHRHEGEEDSIVKQWEEGTYGLYRELRERNVYINAPDWHFMTGANMAVMGYVEESFNITRPQQLIYGREMAYYGTFGKTPAMGWTLVPLSPYKGGDASSFWPYNERIQDYDYITAVNMLYGVVGSYRGANGLYQEGPAQNVMETWGEFYNKYRDVLGGDIVHIAPPISESYNVYGNRIEPSSDYTTAIDGMIHVSPDSEQKGLAAFFNQTRETVTQKVKIPLYYTGLTDLKSAPAPIEGSHYRLSGCYTDMYDMPGVPEIPEVTATPTEKTAYVCIGDLEGQEYVIDSNGNIEVELTMEPNTYTWLTVYDPQDIPDNLISKEEIASPKNLSIRDLSSSQVTLTWDSVQVNGRDVKEYHVYRNGKYIGKTFSNEYVDKTLQANEDYQFEVVAVYNTVAGEKSSIDVSTTPDTKAPEIASVKALSKNQIQIVFNESVSSDTASVAANYAVENNTVAKAELQSDSKTVTLTLGSALTPFKDIQVTVNNVKDLAGNAIAANSQKDFVFGYLREFKFEEESGNEAIDSINGVNGVIFGDNLVRKSGVSGTGFEFDGRINYINAGPIVNNLNEYSIGGWFNAESVEGNQTLIGSQRDSVDGWRWNLYLEEGVLKFEINNGKGSYPGFEATEEISVKLNSGTQKIVGNQWNYFSVVRNGDTFTLYLNGEKVAEDTKAGIDQSLSPYSSWIGGYSSPGGGDAVYCFKGLMDEIVFYNTPLSEQKVKELYDENVPKELDKSALKDLIDEAKAIEQGAFTDASYQALQNAIEEAEAKLDTIATIDQLNAAIDALQEAIDGLTESKPELVSKDALQKLYDENKDKEKGNYTSGSWDRFQEALKNAAEVLDTPNATQKQVDEAKAELEDAIGKLAVAVPVVNKDKLQQLYDQYLGKEQGNYTDLSFDMLISALGNAFAVLNDKEATQQEVDDAYTRLENAVKGLTEKASETKPSTGAETGDTSTTTVLVFLALAICAAGGFCLNAIMKKKKYEK